MSELIKNCECFFRQNKKENAKKSSINGKNRFWLFSQRNQISIQMSLTKAKCSVDEMQKNHLHYNRITHTPKRITK